jgi:hypothetical protein
MAAGHKGGGSADNEYHDEATWLKFIVDHPLVLTWLQRPYRLSRDYSIPYLGGISKDGGTVFLDHRYDPILHCLEHGHILDSSETIPDHEITEYVCVRFYGMVYMDSNPFRNPHIWGNTAERLAVMAAGCEWGPYNKALDKQLSGVELEKVTRCPSNLALYPYQDDPKLLAKIRAAMEN